MVYWSRIKIDLDKLEKWPEKIRCNTEKTKVKIST